jgi:sialidase-1
MRDVSRSGQRIWSRWTWNEDSSGGSWSEFWYANPDPTCMASLLRHSGGALFFANPAHANKRRNMTIRCSTDGGHTWSDGRQIDAGPSAYSCLTELADGNLAILYEAGKTLTFVRFPVAWARASNKPREQAE